MTKRISSLYSELFNYVQDLSNTTFALIADKTRCCSIPQRAWYLLNDEPSVVVYCTPRHIIYRLHNEGVTFIT